MNKRSGGVLPITHMEMTRFNISLEEGVEMVLFALGNALGGEIFVPKIPSYKIGVLAQALAPSCSLVDIGIRPGEKLHEEMITSSDSYNTIDFGKYYAILPSDADKPKFLNHFKGKEVPKGFTYNSGENDQWLSVDDIRNLMVKYIDPNFKPL
jgi:FlaA1/EpsC-like NDP-sugar epimerase